MHKLLQWLSWRHLLHSPARAFLSVMGVALGVSVFVAIRLASGSAVTSFKDSVNALAGEANLQITSTTGQVPEGNFAELLQVDGVQAAWPVIQTLAGNPENVTAPLLIVGLDFFSDPRVFETATAGNISRNDIIAMVASTDGIAVSESYAKRNGWTKGDSVRLTYAGKIRSLVVRMILPETGAVSAYGGDTAFMDIAAAQEQFDKLGGLDRIDLLIEQAKLDSAVKSIEKLFPGSVVATPQSRGKQVESMIRSFRLNLLALSLVALFVGAFLIFNSISLSVIQRRREIGIARSIGVSRWQIMGVFLAEGLLYGFVGGIVGSLLGVGLAQTALGGVSSTISSMYVSVNATRIFVDPTTLLIGFAIGALASILSSFAPAVEAALTPPGVTSREGSVMQRRRRSLALVTSFAVAMLLAGYASAIAALNLRSGVAGFASAAFILCGSALAAPMLTTLLAKSIGYPVRALAGVEGLIASRWVVYSLERTAVVIAALSAAVTMLIAVNMMVGSFRQTVELWLDQTVKADIFVQPTSTVITGETATLPSEIVTVMSNIEGTDSVDTLRAEKVRFKGRIIELYAIDFVTTKRHSRLMFLQGDNNNILEKAVAENQILVSETFYNRFGIGQGQQVSLNTPKGDKNYTIAGVFYDYTSEAGLILMHLPQYRMDFHDFTVNTAAIYVRDGYNPAEVRKELMTRLKGQYDVTVMLNRSLKDRALEIFDRTFAITSVLKLVAIVVAVMGVITTMAALILQRQREIGILRSIGASRRQLVKMIVIESCLIGMFAVIIGSVCGPAVAMVLIKVINKLFFGWTIIPMVNPAWFLEAALWVIAASVFAGIFPARITSRLQPASAVRAE